MKALVLRARDERSYDVEAAALASVGGVLETTSFGELRASRGVRADVIVNAGEWRLDGALLDSVESLRALVSYGVGLDWIDVDEATARGLLVVHTPLANVDDVAVHALALLLACSRRLPQYDRHVRAGGFRPQGWPPLRRLSAQTLGLVAFGNTARRLVPLVRPLGPRVLAWDPFVADEDLRAAGVERCDDLDGLLAASDLVSVHVPATPATVGLLGRERLARLRPGAIVVVTSRGAVYDADALADALADGRVAAAGLDVFPEEPLPADHPLTRLPNAILTPHVAGYSDESDLAARQAVADALVALAAGEVPAGAVNAARLNGSRGGAGPS